MKKQVLVSDKSNAEIGDGEGAIVTVKFNSAPNGAASDTFESHVTTQEAQALTKEYGSRPIKRRGRPSGGTSNAKKK